VPLASFAGRVSVRRLFENVWWDEDRPQEVADHDHVLPARRDLRPRPRHHLGRRAAQLAVRLPGQPSSGAAVFVSGAYWYLYAREPAPPPGDTPRGRDADGARAARERVAAEA
jgi:hypothetical protein